MQVAYFLLTLFPQNAYFYLVDLVTLHSTHISVYRQEIILAHSFEIYSSLSKLFDKTSTNLNELRMANSEKQDGLALLAELDKMQCGEHVIMSKSTLNYVKRQWIATKSNLYILLFVVYTFRGSILSFYQQDWIISMTGDYTHVLGNTTLISRIIFLISFCVLIFIIYSHYLENRFQLTQIDSIFDMIGGK